MQTISVEPAADFGTGHGLLVVSDGAEPGTVVIGQADRVVYIPLEWVDRVVCGDVPWAEVVAMNEFSFMGAALKIRAAKRTVIYQVVGSCGPRVLAWLCQQPD